MENLQKHKVCSNYFVMEKIVCPLSLHDVWLAQVEQVEEIAHPDEVLVIIVIHKDVLFVEAEQVNVPILDQANVVRHWVEAKLDFHRWLPHVFGVHFLTFVIVIQYLQLIQALTRIFIIHELLEHVVNLFVSL